MTLVVPYDGSVLARAALRRADQLSDPLEEGVVAVAVIKSASAEYAREKGWIGPGDPFDRAAIAAELGDEVAEICPDAAFVTETVEKYAPRATIARAIRRRAASEGASMIVVGSENAGRLVTPLSSVGGSVASSTKYDVLLVRHPVD